MSEPLVPADPPRFRQIFRGGRQGELSTPECWQPLRRARYPGLISRKPTPLPDWAQSTADVVQRRRPGPAPGAPEIETFVRWRAAAGGACQPSELEFLDRDLLRWSTDHLGEMRELALEILNAFGLPVWASGVWAYLDDQRQWWVLPEVDGLAFDGEVYDPEPGLVADLPAISQIGSGAADDAALRPEGEQIDWPAAEWVEDQGGEGETPAAAFRPSGPFTWSPVVEEPQASRVRRISPKHAYSDGAEWLMGRATDLGPAAGPEVALDTGDLALDWALYVVERTFESSLRRERNARLQTDLDALRALPQWQALKSAALEAPVEGLAEFVMNLETPDHFSRLDEVAFRAGFTFGEELGWRAAGAAAPRGDRGAALRRYAISLKAALPAKLDVALAYVLKALSRAAVTGATPAASLEAELRHDGQERLVGSCRRVLEVISRRERRWPHPDRDLALEQCSSITAKTIREDYLSRKTLRRGRRFRDRSFG